MAALKLLEPLLPPPPYFIETRDSFISIAKYAHRNDKTNEVAKQALNAPLENHIAVPIEFGDAKIAIKA